MPKVRGDQSNQMYTKKNKNFPLYLCCIISVVVVIFDQLSKNYFQSILSPHESIHLFGTDFLQITVVYNSGAAFSIATGQTWIISLIAVAMVIFMLKLIPRVRSWWWISALGLIVGGAVGNLLDRIFRSPGFFRGEVVDFISVGWWPVFNIADCAICVGAFCLACAILFSPENPLERNGSPHP